MSYLVLLRHGQSEWNRQGRFTGRYDCDLSDQGREEAANAGRKLKALNVVFDAVHASTLCRAYDTAKIGLINAGQEKMLSRIIQYKDLCERDYGDLTGLFHIAAVEKYGSEQVMRWRRAFDEPPPGSKGESVHDVLRRRVQPYYIKRLKPLIDAGKDVLAVGHNNSLRPLMILLKEETPESITKADLKTGVPIVYQIKNGVIVNRLRLE